MTLPNLRAQNEGPGGGYPPGPCNAVKTAVGSAAAAAVTARLGAAAARARAALLGLRALGLRALAAARRLAGLAAAAGAVDETQFLGGKITHVQSPVSKLRSGDRKGWGPSLARSVTIRETIIQWAKSAVPQRDRRHGFCYPRLAGRRTGSGAPFSRLTLRQARRPLRRRNEPPSPVR